MIETGWTERIKELEDENDRLREALKTIGGDAKDGLCHLPDDVEQISEDFMGIIGLAESALSEKNRLLLDDARHNKLATVKDS